MEFNRCYRRAATAFLCVALSISIVYAHAQSAPDLPFPVNGVIDGTVVSVQDGDTLDIQRGGETFTIRVEGIDAPEKGQAFSNQAKKRLSVLCLSLQAKAYVKEKDQYGRFVARVLVDGVDVSYRMVLEGFAWHFVKYSSDARLAALEANARDQRRGLWKLPAPMAPWELRANQATEKKRQQEIQEKRKVQPWVDTPSDQIAPLYSSPRQALNSTAPKASGTKPSFGSGYSGAIPPGYVVFNKNSGIYHEPGAAALKNMNPANAMVIPRAQAEAMGRASRAKN